MLFVQQRIWHMYLVTFRLHLNRFARHYRIHLQFNSIPRHEILFIFQNIDTLLCLLLRSLRLNDKLELRWLSEKKEFMWDVRVRKSSNVVSLISTCYTELSKSRIWCTGNDVKEENWSIFVKIFNVLSKCKNEVSVELWKKYYDFHLTEKASQDIEKKQRDATQLLWQAPCSCSHPYQYIIKFM